ncbi:peptidase M14 [Microvirga sp. ACRRW]|uniref:M14 family zinc carboxypeptidase n=1 Tax=Microvirga sp. ACRRW TaxID=2918205 RepID=UPI001EF5F565|nr:M14 family zinc carboxypeptidase [Microvirga sp. ACRRW]MCG7391725.1 peptidase M14 [Microvirga sp. ACRRW]
MTILLDERVPRTLDILLRDWASDKHRGTRLEAWLFEDEAARRAGEARLAQAGVTARLRSAYKPLVHAFLEEIDTNGLASVVVRYPVHPEASPIRFLSEAYPLAALYDHVAMSFEPDDADLNYRVQATYQDGRVVEHKVFAPNRTRTNHLDQIDLVPTGWLIVSDRADGEPDIDEPVETEAEIVFHKVMAAVAAHEWPPEEPYVETLAIDVAIPGIERPLSYGDEVMSTREALHEDFYFSILEFFKRRSNRPPEDRGLQPGQIVPDIRANDGDAHVRVALRGFDASQNPARPEQDLEIADAAPSLMQLQRELAALPGETFEGMSVEGRPVRGLYRSGSRPAVLVTSGQHANETSAPVGAFRAVRRLLANPEANIAFIPVENPDGYALHGRLCEANPRHMHHAARYTSRGNDLEFGKSEPAFEIGARNHALAMSGAQLHINLHGYPAHEWTRPFTGYLPRGFELWSIPKGFFLIMRHHPSWGETARTLIEAVTKGLSAVPGLVEFNRRQIEICAIHSGGKPYEIINGVPCLITAEERHPSPLTIVTEFPDETIYGDAYRFAHTVQMATVIAAEEAYASIMENVA